MIVLAILAALLVVAVVGLVVFKAKASRPDVAQEPNRSEEPRDVVTMSYAGWERLVALAQPALWIGRQAEFEDVSPANRSWLVNWLTQRALPGARAADTDGETVTIEMESEAARLAFTA